MRLVRTPRLVLMFVIGKFGLDRLAVNGAMYLAWLVEAVYAAGMTLEAILTVIFSCRHVRED